MKHALIIKSYDKIWSVKHDDEFNLVACVTVKTTAPSVALLQLIQDVARGPHEWHLIFFGR